ncbi:hypothetical protein BB559_003882, partial [Furculomyces boomerangus]
MNHQKSPNKSENSVPSSNNVGAFYSIEDHSQFSTSYSLNQIKGSSHSRNISREHDIVLSQDDRTQYKIENEDIEFYAPEEKEKFRITCIPIITTLKKSTKDTLSSLDRQLIDLAKSTSSLNQPL